MLHRPSLFQPLPELPFKRALLLRLLMLPNHLLVRATGVENLPRNGGPVVFAFNHNNSLEALMVPIWFIYRMGGRTISFVIDWMYGKLPLLGTLMEMIEPVYVYNKRSSLGWVESKRPREAPGGTLDRCIGKIEAGRSIGIFPEGRRNPHPHQLAKAKPGIGHILLSTGVPVVPVGIDFPVRIKQGRIPAVGRTIVRIGKPMRFDGLSADYCRLDAAVAEERAERSRMAAAVTRRIMQQLAGLSGKEYVHPQAQASHQQPCNPLTEEPLCLS